MAGREASDRTAHGRTFADLPEWVEPPFQVYVNGVPQHAGRDYRYEGGALVFRRPLRREGRLGFWRWASMFLGVAGTYRQNDTVDVVCERGGERRVVTGLPLRSGDDV